MEDSGRPAIAVLISGRGSNLRALLEAEQADQLGGRIALVVSNRPEAAGLMHARAAGIETVVLPHSGYATREAFGAAIAQTLRTREIHLVCLAGFTRLLSDGLCGEFRWRILNIHPSLLPAFPGPHAQRQALDHGVKLAGATVHFVTAELDAGPIIQQAAVPVRDDDTVESLAARILAVEHRLYPAAVRRVLRDRWRIEGRRVVFDAVDRTTTGDV